jgi:hypothetical protein
VTTWVRESGAERFEVIGHVIPPDSACADLGVGVNMTVNEQAALPLCRTLRGKLEGARQQNRWKEAWAKAMVSQEGWGSTAIWAIPVKSEKGSVQCQEAY